MSSGIDPFHPKYMRSESATIMPKLGRTVAWFVAAVVFSILALSFFVETNVVASVEGRLVVAANTQEIQAPFHGRIVRIHTLPYARVKKGQIIFSLDTTERKLSLEEALILLEEKNEIVSRFELLQKKVESFIRLPTIPSLKTESPTNNEKLHINFELLGADLLSFKERVTILRRKQGLVREKFINSQHTKKLHNKAVIEAKNRFKSVNELASEGFFPKADLSIAREELVELEARSQELRSLEKQFSIQLEEQQVQIDEYVSNHSLKIRNDISNTKFEIRRLISKKQKLVNEIALSDVKASMNGVIQDISIPGPTVVVQSGQILARLVPKEQVKEFEVLVGNREIGFVKVGQKAMIKIDTYPFERYGTISGVIDDIASDAVYLKEKGWLYKGKVRPEKYHMLVDGRVLPLKLGETAIVDLVLGKRRLIDRILEPVFRYSSIAFQKY
ncbi:MAG: HlyD family efflux transporter periplasmic adaptor subunit [Gammaproteobacteria bacterium]|nr:HlyD family efflux transporter periplasmic adaptor subunit [Gammaproteobacteria bacterium]